MKVARSALSLDRGRLREPHDELHDERELDGGADDDERVVDETAPEQVVGGQQAEQAARDEQHDGQGLEHARSLRRRSVLPDAASTVGPDRRPGRRGR